MFYELLKFLTYLKILLNLDSMGEIVGGIRVPPIARNLIIFIRSTMLSKKRYRTKYPCVTYIKGMSAKGKPERIYYIRYYKDGKRVEERAGNQYIKP